MRILWITNIMLPPICEAMNMSVPAVGGWMYSSLKNLKEKSDNDIFAVATVWKGEKFIRQEINGIIYYLFPLNGKDMTHYNHHLEAYWRNIRNEFQPDVIHIHGSEFSHGLAYVKACGHEGVVVSIQGLVSAYARYYKGEISNSEIKKNLTIRDIIKGGINKGQNDFTRRGRLEIELLKSVEHIIGRTEWDKSHSWAINPKAKYHHVGETLRESFYKNKWSYDKCEPHTIFISQASYPIKGFHKILEALPIVLREYPDTKVYVAGTDETARPWYRLTNYGKYLKNLIRKNKLKDHVFFTGVLDEQQMCQRYLESNLFICCSAIENSPNSLGEAQMLGMPHLATFTGGIPEIVNYDPEVLYRFEETEMLAKKICDVFAKRDNLTSLNFNPMMYDASINTLALTETYREICS